MTKPSQFHFAPVYFFLGFAAIILQSMLIREFLVIAYGNELIIGTIFFAWFFWIAIGALLSALFLRRSRELGFFFWLILLTGLVLFPEQVILIRLSKAIFSVPVGTFMPFSRAMFLALVSISPSALMIGLTFPLGAQIFRKNFHNELKVVGHLYVFEALGSLIGGLLFTFLLLTHLQPFQISLLLFFLSLSVFILTERKSLWNKKLNALIFVAILSGIIYSFLENHINNWSLGQRWFAIAGKQTQLISSVETPYERISIARFEGQYSLYQNGDFSFSFPDPYLAKIKANLLLLQHPMPKRILVISTGISDLGHYLLKYSTAEVDWVLRDRKLLGQIEPLLPDSIRSDFFSARMHLFFGDGRRFVKNSDNLYDLIYLELPPPATASLNRFYSQEFFRLTKTALKPDGVLAFQLPLSANYLGKEILQFAASIYFTVRSQFEETLLTSGDPNFIFATNQSGNITANFDTIVNRCQKISAYQTDFSPYSLLPFFDSERIEFLATKLAEFPDSTTNTDLQPVSYFYNLMLWNKYSGNDLFLTAAWNFVRRITLWHVLIFLVFLLSLYVFQLFFKPDRMRLLRCNSLASVAIAGFTAMGLDIILLFGFQNLFGSLYQNVALVTGIFMFGLAVGSWFMNQKLNFICNEENTFITLELLTIIAALLLPHLLEFLDSNLPILKNQTMIYEIFLFYILLAGALTGAVFPLAVKGVSKSGLAIGSTASRVDAADHTGACLGSFLSATFLLPVFGMQGMVVLIAGFNLLMILFWLLLRFMAKKST